MKLQEKVNRLIGLPVVEHMVPPNLREADSPDKSCNTCKYYAPLNVGDRSHGVCLDFDGYGVDEDDMCDGYARSADESVNENFFTLWNVAKSLAGGTSNRSNAQAIDPDSIDRNAPGWIKRMMTAASAAVPGIEWTYAKSFDSAVIIVKHTKNPRIQINWYVESIGFGTGVGAVLTFTGAASDYQATLKPSARSTDAFIQILKSNFGL
jgi:hypothetical protein